MDTGGRGVKFCNLKTCKSLFLKFLSIRGNYIKESKSGIDVHFRYLIEVCGCSLQLKNPKMAIPYVFIVTQRK